MAAEQAGEFRTGQRVIGTMRPYFGREGTIVKPARLLWNKAWLVEFDDTGEALRVNRDRVMGRCLAPIERRDQVLADTETQQIGNANWYLILLAPFLGFAWTLSPVLGIPMTVAVAALAFVSFRRRRQ